jgi:hypothetical protein
VRLSILLVTVALIPAAAGGKVAWVQRGFFTHPGNRGTWTMSGAVSDSGTFASVCVTCQGATADLRVKYKGKRGTFVLLAKVRSFHKQTKWTLLSGTGFYKGMHGQGTCVGRLLVNEVSFRDRCTGVITR